MRGARCLAIVASLVLCAAACSGGSTSGSVNPSSSEAVSSAALLGPDARATGEPVTVGFITDGDTNGGAAGNEEPVAKATVQWLNEHMNGLAGHPISLDICVDQLDPGTAIDCANQMIRDDVAVVVIGSSGVIESSWNILHDAHIPVINNAVTISTLLEDPASTFIVNDPLAQVVDVPIAVAKDEQAEKVSVVVVDLPIATDIYRGSTPDLFERNGLDLDVVPVPLGTPDITPQAQQIEQNNPDGLVSLVGPDAFCIAALQGLRAVGFQGPRFMIQQCLTDATREALSGGELTGIKTVSLAPLGDDSDASMLQYQAVLDTYATTKVDPSDIVGLMVFQSLGALSVGTQGLNSAVTPAAVTAALKGMENAVLPGSGGRHFRCGGQASSDRPAVCSVGVFVATLDAQGNPENYTVENDAPIGGPG